VSELRTVAALYIDPRGVYATLPAVDCWDESRDARLYTGPHPVVAHPPCERWGSYWFGSPSSAKRFLLGDDGGCFEAALVAVRNHGGVLEHPANTRAWQHFGLKQPPVSGGWVRADIYGGWSCHIEQGHYGHRARKPTWLYAFGFGPARVPHEPVMWGPSAIVERSLRQRTRGVCELLSKQQRRRTPPAFAEWLVSLARASSVTSAERVA
jgi:hypothetical protein